ncbi:putative membrane protein [Campylobacter showae]|uniref:Uncharacterized protein n=1 Tax=Campylobacter showae RM3277 TaxID=553219 RepID=C6RCK7_9BACT|nr:hypothetical protein [Campylobacter showae]EET80881.1 hypothetical protein CAMSH0001_2384 [Campylobacter showae RM3277]QCD49782.1 putative membrane protein [Campylobacter showae]
MTNVEQNEKAAQDGERERRQRTDDRALALVTARFLATHRPFFLLNLLQLAVCLSIFANFVVVAGFLAAFAVLFYLHIRLHFDSLIFKDFADERLGCGKFDAALLELNLTSKPPKIRDMKSRCAGALRLYKLTAALSSALILAALAMRYLG